MERTDAILMEILGERKTITGFLDAIFGFLSRNSDFYHTKTHPSEQIGFAKGVREQIVFGAMQRYNPECQLNYLASQDEAPPAITEIEVETEIETETVEETVKETVKEPVASAPPAAVNTKAIFAPADYKNGSLHENYCWSQTLKDVEVQVKLPKELQSAKLISIKMKPDFIAVGSRGKPDVIVSGQTYSKFKQNDAIWTIAEGKLILNFDKSKEVWWEKLFLVEDSVDLKKLDCERYIDDLPEESQAAIHKLRVQQIQQDFENAKIEGETTANETLDRLRTAWDAENSPFRGQPFDPSVIKFS